MQLRGAHTMPAAEPACEGDLEGIVGSGRGARTAPMGVRRPWLRIKNPKYSRIEGRRELFQSRREPQRLPRFRLSQGPDLLFAWRCANGRTLLLRFPPVAARNTPPIGGRLPPFLVLVGNRPLIAAVATAPRQDGGFAFNGCLGPHRSGEAAARTVVGNPKPHRHCPILQQS